MHTEPTNEELDINKWPLWKSITVLVVGNAILWIALSSIILIAIGISF